MANPFFITTRVSNKLSEEEYKNLLKNLTNIILGTKLVVNPQTETFNLVASRTTNVQNRDINNIINSINLDGTTFNLSQELLNKIAELANTDRLLSEKLSTLEGIPADLTKNLGELQVKALLSKSIIQLQDNQKQAIILDGERLEGENAKLKQDLDEAKAELQAIQRQAVQTLSTSDKSKEQLKELLAKLELAQKTSEELEQRLLAADATIKSFDVERKELTDANEMAQEQLASLQDVTQQATSRAETAEANLAQSQAQAQEAETKAAELLAQAQEAESQTAQAQAQAQEAEANRGEWERYATETIALKDEELRKAQEEISKGDAKLKQTVESAMTNIRKEKNKGETLLNLVGLLNEKVANVNKLLG